MLSLSPFLSVTLITRCKIFFAQSAISAPLAANDDSPPLLKHLQHVQLAALLSQPPHQLQLVPFLFQMGDSSQQAEPVLVSEGDLGELHPGDFGQGVAHHNKLGQKQFNVSEVLTASFHKILRLLLLRLNAT